MPAVAVEGRHYEAVYVSPDHPVNLPLLLSPDHFRPNHLSFQTYAAHRQAGHHNWRLHFRIRPRPVCLSALAAELTQQGPWELKSTSQLVEGRDFDAVLVSPAHVLYSASRTNDVVRPLISVAV